MSSSIEVGAYVRYDASGHSPRLALPGNEVIIALECGGTVGLGEASLSGDDGSCLTLIRNLVSEILVVPEPESIESELSRLARAMPSSLVGHTAISAIGQALCDLVARIHGVGVWRLLAERRHEMPEAYATINRKLRSRTDEDYLMQGELAEACGFRSIKCAPFGDSPAPANKDRGLDVLMLLRERFPGIGLKSDCHGRLSLDDFDTMWSTLEALELDWIEEPTADMAEWSQLREGSRTPIAGVELAYGTAPYLEAIEDGAVDIVMPDVKHVGGPLALRAVAESVAHLHKLTAPHNPCGPIATAATLHAALASPGIACIEVNLPTSPEDLVCRLLRDEDACMTEGLGLGVTLEDLRSADFRLEGKR